MNRIELTDGRLSATVYPDYGGMAGKLTLDGVEILHLDEGAPAAGRGAGGRQPGAVSVPQPDRGGPVRTGRSDLPHALPRAGAGLGLRRGGSHPGKRDADTDQLPGVDEGLLSVRVRAPAHLRAGGRPPPADRAGEERKRPGDASCVRLAPVLRDHRQGARAPDRQHESLRALGRGGQGRHTALGDRFGKSGGLRALRKGPAA